MAGRSKVDNSGGNWHDDLYYLRAAIEVSKAARESGNTPFGAVLVDENGNIILKQGNVEVTENRCTGHAETALVERASQQFSKEKLRGCSLYTTCEPCAMCCGAIYWGNIGRVVYGVSEKKLLELTGDNEQNPTFDLPSREVFARGQKDIQVVGPCPEVELEVVAVHEGYWD